MKTIYLTTSKYAARLHGYMGNAQKVNLQTNIDLDKLSPAARVVAENVYTTEHGDDLGNIFVAYPPQRDAYIREGRGDELPKLEKFFGVDWLDRPTVKLWCWDFLRKNETPEQYFERQVKEMREFGVLKILRSSLRDINFSLV